MKTPTPPPLLSRVLVLLLLVASTLSIYVTPRAPYDQGELETALLQESSSKESIFSLQIFYPNATGTFAVNVFLPGLDGNAPGIAYSRLFHRIASHGIITVAVTTLPTVPFPVEGLDKKMRSELSFLQANLNSLLNAQLAKYNFHLTADFENSLLLSGHSAGCKIMVSLFEEGCIGAKGLILLNPVDGLDPWGLIPSYVIHPPNKVNYTTPVLVVGAGLGTVPGIHIGKLIPACAPAGLNFPRFYNASYCPRWQLNATEYGHADLLDPAFVEIIRISHFCSFNEKVKDFDPYRWFMAGTVVSYVSGIFQGNCTALRYIQDVNLIPSAIKTTVLNDVGCSACPKPFCSHQ